MTGSPASRLLVGLLLAALGLTVVPVVGGGVAAADPKPSLNEVQQRVDDLDRQAAAAAERFNAAKVALDETHRRMRSAQHRYAATQRQLDTMNAVVGRIAVATYKSGGIDASVQLVLADDPTEFLRQAADLSQLNRQQSAMLQDLAAARLRAAAERKAVADQQARAEALKEQIATERRGIESRLTEARDLLARLEATQRARLEAQRRAAERRALTARADAMRASRSSTRGDSFPTYDGPASGRAAVAVKTAYAQLGDPYVWGADGPTSFDCSGLTMFAWGAAGVSLPHSSSAQYASVRHVAVSDLQPGDLVFYYSPISHVGIYIGGGKIIDAPYPGLSVHIVDLHSMPLVGAGRP